MLGRKKGSYTKRNILLDNRHIIVDMLKRDRSIGDICRRFGISRDTFAKFRDEHEDVRKVLDEKECRRKDRAQRRRSGRP